MIARLKKLVTPKTLKYVAITISAFLLIAVVGYFSLRNYVLQKVMAKVKAAVENRTHLTLAVGEARFEGVSTISIKTISIVPKGKDTLFSTDSVQFTIKLLPALLGKVRLGELKVAHTKVYLRKDSLQTNFRGILKPSPKKEKKEKSNEDVSQTTFETIKKLLGYVPDDVLINDAKLTIKFNDSLQYITLTKLDWVKGKFKAQIKPQEKYAANNWIAEGFFDKYDIKGKVDIHSEGSDLVNVYFAGLFGSGLHFNKLGLEINELDYARKTLTFKARGEFDNLHFYNARLALDTVVIGKTGGNLDLQINRSFVKIDSTSTFVVNDIMMSASAQYPLGNEKEYALTLKMPSTPAQKFFNSLPVGMFNSFSGIEAKGNLSYQLQCRMDGNMPDSLQFESELKREDFAIVKFGDVNFGKMNGPFTHTVYEGGRPIRSFVVGEGNPGFTFTENVNPYFKNAVLTNEDPSFFYHHGFIPQSFRDAIVAVYKAGFKFVRGGSTISMQLVKNVFLERRKTISRKAEEALIVWLIENNRLTSKERMFEVYLNIIELAPGVYGIGEGAAFYFNKKPADLTLAESLYLSNIIPRPKAFKYGFEGDGTLKPWLQEKANFVLRRMVQREWVPPTDTIGFSPLIELKGPAKNFVVLTDSLSINLNDSLTGGDGFFDE